MQTIEYICNIDMDLLPYNPRFIKLVLAKKHKSLVSSMCTTTAQFPRNSGIEIT